MELTPSTPTPKEGLMKTYEMRAEYTDGTFDVIRVEASSFGEADAIVRDDPEVERAFCLCVVDRTPVQPLVVFA